MYVQVTINSDFVESFLEAQQQKLSDEIRSLSSTETSLRSSVQQHRDIIHNLESFQKIIGNAISCHKDSQEKQLEKLRLLTSLSAFKENGFKSHGLSISKQLNLVYSLLQHTASITTTTSTFPPVSSAAMEVVDAPTPTGSNDSSSQEPSLQFQLREIFTPLLETALLSATRTAAAEGSSHANHLVHSGELPSSSPSPSSSSVERFPAQRRPDLFTLENSGKPTYMITFTLMDLRRYDLPVLGGEGNQVVVHDVPAHTPIVCYSESTSQTVVLRDMDSDVVLKRYGFRRPMGLAKYLNFLFIVDGKSKCVYTIDLLSDDNNVVVFPSMKKEQNIFITPSGLAVVDQYLLVMDCGPRAKPSPYIHVFDLQASEYPLVNSFPLLMKLQNTNPCCLSVKDEGEKSFYIISDDELVTCYLIPLTSSTTNNAEEGSIYLLYCSYHHLNHVPIHYRRSSGVIGITGCISEIL